ncbi:MAG: nucleoside-diphosphate sugar epimerase/dehydratase [Actinomycetota bacterium]|nr:nucleoside-diphosphate sugar epimerase/dehydratase [Actinomycetota bacterium]
MIIIKKLAYLINDILLASAALMLAYLLRFGFDMQPRYTQSCFALLPLAVSIKISVFYVSGFYKQLWRYASLQEGVRLLKGISVASLVLTGAVYFIQSESVPRGVLVIDWLLTLGLVGGSRFFVRVKKDLLPNAKKMRDGSSKRVIVVGAGEAGCMLAKHMQAHPDMGYHVVAFLDDNPTKKNLMIHGVKVAGSTRSIPHAIAALKADELILAIPSAANRERRRLALECQELGIPCKTVPSMAEIVEEREDIFQIRDIDLKELLGRRETEFDLQDSVGCHRGQTVLITGAAGSIGSELCRQLIALEPAKVVAVDISENGLYHIEEELLLTLNGQGLLFEARVTDIKDATAVERVFASCKPDIVFHAAAYKHVPMMERHPIEALQNNFLGTRILIDAAQRHNTKRFTLISTDKAVNPTSMMGLSKQLAEHSIMVASCEPCDTRFMAVRFGNVLGSNGSVIPKFKRQIQSGDALTVTHRDITRYFMTIQEAVHLVVQANTIGEGGEIFVLNMGEPVRIIDLARSVIRLSGLEPERDIPIRITGLRPGEKMQEELFGEDEEVQATTHPQILKVSREINEIFLRRLLKEIESTLNNGDALGLAQYLKQNLPIRAA